MNNRIRRGVVAALVAGAFAAAGGAHASISSISGQIVQISPPPSVSFDGGNGALESNDHMFTFDERQNVTLATDLPTDISQPGAYGPDCGCNPLTPGLIPAGTTVSSLFVHADPVGTPSKPNVLQATIVTSSDIVGIEVCGNASPHCGVNGLDISDPILGAPGTIYPTDVFGRSMNFSTQKDFLIWQIDNRTVMIQTATRDHADQVRIITKGTPPPATIIVKKVTDPSPDPTNSSFTFTGDAAGSIGNGQTITVGNLAAGTYHSSEVVPAGWQLTSISCDDSNSSGNVATATATFNVTAGQTVTCTFTDRKLGTIIVKKVTDPTPDLSNSLFTFTGDAAGQIHGGQSITVGNLAPGTYHSTEVVPAGWQLASISCDDSNSSGNASSATATFQVEAGETVTCTFLDREQLGSQGCTPGYWKQPQHFHSWTTLKPTDSFEAVFGVDAFPGNPSLVTVLSTGGGGVNALGRMAVSALLNALSPSVAYPITSGQVITQVRNAILSHNATTIESLKNQLDAWNNQRCTLN